MKNRLFFIVKSIKQLFSYRLSGYILSISIAKKQTKSGFLLTQYALSKTTRHVLALIGSNIDKVSQDKRLGSGQSFCRCRFKNLRTATISDESMKYHGKDNNAEYISHAGGSLDKPVIQLESEQGRDG